jgi:hypothetical protein
MRDLVTFRGEDHDKIEGVSGDNVFLSITFIANPVAVRAFWNTSEDAPCLG